MVVDDTIINGGFPTIFGPNIQLASSLLVQALGFSCDCTSVLQSGSWKFQMTWFSLMVHCAVLGKIFNIGLLMKLLGITLLSILVWTLRSIGTVRDKWNLNL